MLGGESSMTIEQELRREMPSGHVLRNRSLRAIAYSPDTDDILLYLGISPPSFFSEVHLTGIVETRPEFPSVRFHEDLEALRDARILNERIEGVTWVRRIRPANR
jgi:hypothetical protein